MYFVYFEFLVFDRLVPKYFCCVTLQGFEETKFSIVALVKRIHDNYTASESKLLYE